MQSTFLIIIEGASSIVGLIVGAVIAALGITFFFVEIVKEFFDE